MRLFLVMSALLAAPPAAAQQVPRMSKAEIAGVLDPGQELESRTDGDLNLDGQGDTVIVGRSEEKRILTMMLAVKGEFDLSHLAVGALSLDPYPLGPATVTMSKGVLKVEDLTGGTTAVSATYRYRLVPGDVPRMRLIGLDATLYSRTYAHDGFELSWNVLTGDLVTREMRLNKKGGEAGYDKIAEKRSKRVTKPLYMEDTPNPEELIESVR